MKSLDYNDFIKKFKNNIKDNMASSKKDKGSNNLYYKSYYWTALDLLLMAMDGNLLEDIDGEYWKFFDKLVKDKDFLHMGGFLFCYKPLMDNDDVTQDESVITNVSTENEETQTDSSTNDGSNSNDATADDTATDDAAEETTDAE